MSLIRWIRRGRAAAAGTAGPVATPSALTRAVEDLRAEVMRLEAQRVNAEARLLDAERVMTDYRNVIGRLEAAVADHDAKLADRRDDHGQPLTRPLPLSQRQLAYMHVPKCGGTALASYLRAQFSPCRYVDNLAAFDQLDAEYIASLDLVHAHFSFRHVAKLRRGCILVSIVREPVDRLMSFYFNIREKETGMEVDHPELVQACRSLSFREFVEHEDPRLRRWTRNCMARQFADDMARLDESPAEELASRAIANATAFEYVGIHEDFSTSLNILQFFMNWPLAEKIPEANVTRERSTPADLGPDVIERVQDLNRADMILYDHLRTRHAELKQVLMPLIERRRETLAFMDRVDASA